MMRRRKSKEERKADMEKLAAGRSRNPMQPQQGQTSFVRPATLQPGVTKVIIAHRPEGDVVVEDNRQDAAPPIPPPTQGPGAEQGAPPPAPPQAMPPQPQAAPQPPHPTQPPQQVPLSPQSVPAGAPPPMYLPQQAPPQAAPQARPGGRTSVIHPGEMAPTSNVHAAGYVPEAPQARVAQGMYPQNRQQMVRPGVFPSTSQVVPQGGPQVPAAPQQPVELVSEVRPAEDLPEPMDITVFVTSWMRPGLLRPQVIALAGQSRRPLSIVAWVNAPTHVQPGASMLDEQVLATVVQVRSTINWGPWPRFFLAAEARTEYVAILDDDVVPGPGWLEAAIAAVDEGDAVAVTGSVFEDSGAETVVGAVPAPEAVKTPVDAGRQGWVMKREWLEHVLAFERRGTPAYGWGIHVAAALQSKGIRTVVLPYTEGDSTTWGTTVVEADDGLRNAADAADTRVAVFKAYRELGWKILADEKPLSVEEPPEEISEDLAE
jgi:hypothetical protein